MVTPVFNAPPSPKIELLVPLIETLPAWTLMAPPAPDPVPRENICALESRVRLPEERTEDRAAAARARGFRDHLGAVA